MLFFRFHFLRRTNRFLNKVSTHTHCKSLELQLQQMDQVFFSFFRILNSFDKRLVFSRIHSYLLLTETFSFFSRFFGSYPVSVFFCIWRKIGVALLLLLCNFQNMLNNKRYRDLLIMLIYNSKF